MSWIFSKTTCKNFCQIHAILQKPKAVLQLWIFEAWPSELIESFMWFFVWVFWTSPAAYFSLDCAEIRPDYTRNLKDNLQQYSFKQLLQNIYNNQMNRWKYIFVLSKWRIFNFQTIYSLTCNNIFILCSINIEVSDLEVFFGCVYKLNATDLSKWKFVWNCKICCMYIVAGIILSSFVLFTGCTIGCNGFIS